MKELVFDYTKSRWTLLNTASLFAFVLGAVIFPYVILLQWPYHEPLLRALVMSRVSIDPSSIAGNHSIVFLMVLGVGAIFFTLSTKVRGLREMLEAKDGYFSILVAVTFAPSVHELEWFVTDFVHNGIISKVFTWPSIAWLVLPPVFLFMYWRVLGIGKLEILAFLLMGAYYVVWFAHGFLITTYFTGLTPYFMAFWVNANEDVSWAYICAVWVAMKLAYSFWVSRRHEVHVESAVIDPHPHVEDSS